eukprot:8696363-Pyramimonas_sp.AAC.2
MFGLRSRKKASTPGKAEQRSQDGETSVRAADTLGPAEASNVTLLEEYIPLEDDCEGEEFLVKIEQEPPTTTGKVDTCDNPSSCTSDTKNESVTAKIAPTPIIAKAGRAQPTRRDVVRLWSTPPSLQPTTLHEPKFMQQLRQQQEATQASAKAPETRAEDKTSKRKHIDDHQPKRKHVDGYQPSSKLRRSRKLPPGAHHFMQGYIFHCNNSTMHDCIRLNLFGSSRNDWPTMKHLNWRETAVFLFNVSSKTLHGIFECDGRVGLNLNPNAWRGRFPAQAAVHVWAECEPLHIRDFQHLLNKTKAGMVPLILQQSEVEKIIDLFSSSRR